MSIQASILFPSSAIRAVFLYKDFLVSWLDCSLRTMKQIVFVVKSQCQEIKLIFSIDCVFVLGFLPLYTEVVLTLNTGTPELLTILAGKLKKKKKKTNCKPAQWFSDRASAL